jgi:hypothetical protein
LAPLFSLQGYVFFYVCVCRSLTNGFKDWNKKASHIFEYRRKIRTSGVNPTIAIYNASAVKTYSAVNSMARFR